MSGIPEARQNLVKAEENLHTASNECSHAREVNNEIPFGEMNRLLGQLNSFTLLGANKTQETSQDLWRAKQAAEEARERLPDDIPQNALLAEQIEKTKSLAQTRSDPSGFAELLNALDGVRTIVSRLHNANIHAGQEIEVMRTVYEKHATQVHNEAEQI